MLESSVGHPSLRIFVACSGLGRVHRGFETFAQESFDALSGLAGVDAWLLKAAGPRRPREVVVPSLDRASAPAKMLGPLIRDAPDIPGIRAYIFEEVSFALAMLPLVVRYRPDVVLFSDPHIGTVLGRLRRIRGVPAHTRLLFSNGAPLPPPYPRFDHVHHTTAVTYNAALESGEPAERQTLLPYGFAFDERSRPVSVKDHRTLRRRLGLPEDTRVLLSVGAMNSFHKRMDYLIREVALLPEPRPHLVILGDRSDSAAIDGLAADLLGNGGSTLRTVPSGEVTDYYDAADVFALASLNEGFGRVYVEAMARGVPCVAHDSPHTRAIFGAEAYLADLEQTGAGAVAIQAALTAPGGEDARDRRAQSVRTAFSWDVLVPRYASMARICARSGAVGR